MRERRRSSRLLDISNLPDPDDRFELGEIIGEGTCGCIYKGHDKSNDATVAIKVVENVTNQINEIEREYLVLNNHWIHPNTPSFHGIFLKKAYTDDENQIWIVMEYCGGGSLFNLVTYLRKKEMSLTLFKESEIAYILRELVHILDYLHSNNIVHRDLKSSNVLLTSGSEVKLVDYGVAGLVNGCEDLLYDCTGTPYWMAPEVVTADRTGDKGYDSRCDVWSLGIVAIELAQGRTPLHDVEPIRVLFQIPRNPSPSLVDTMTWSNDFVDFVQECLTKDYEERPFAQELLEHPFIKSVSKNPTHTRNMLMKKLKLCKESKFPLFTEPTARSGKFKEDRKTEPTFIEPDDLSLSSVSFNEQSLIQCMRRRFESKIMFAYVGEFLLSMNPREELDMLSHHIMMKYRNRSLMDNPPHVFGVANHVYHSLMHEKKCQRLIFMGECGSGKSVTSHAALKMIIYLSQSAFRDIEEKIRQTHVLLSAFGKCRTHVNEDASKFHKILHLQFSEGGKISGVFVEAFMLEHQTVLTLIRGLIVNSFDESSFHIFKYVLHGIYKNGTMSDLLDSDWQSCEDGRNILNSLKSFGPMAKICEDEFNKVLSAMKIIGFQEEDVSNVLSLVLAVYLISQISFVDDTNSKCCRISNPKVLKWTSKLLGLSDSVEKFEKILTRQGKQYSRQTIQECLKLRDMLLMTLYSRLFDFIVMGINRLLGNKLCASKIRDMANVISIMDFMGFESSPVEVNNVETLSTNICHEQVQHYFRNHLFGWEYDESRRQGLKFGANIQNRQHFLRNDALEVLLGRPVGLVTLLDKESLLLRTRDVTESEHVGRMIQSVFQNSHIVKFESDNQFIIRHHVRPVSYCKDELVSHKNINYLPSDVIKLLSSQSSSVVQYLFNLPLNKTGRLASVESSSRSCDRKFQESQFASKQTFLSNLRFSLLEILKLCISGQPHFVHCFKPNATKLSNHFEDNFMRQQLITANILQTINVRREGFTYRMKFSEFLKRFCFLAFDFDERVVADKDTVRLFMVRMRLDGYCLGKSTVFLKYYHIEYLTKEYNNQMKKIIRVQAAVRSCLAKLRFRKEKWNLMRQILLTNRTAKRWKVYKRPENGVTPKVRRASVTQKLIDDNDDQAMCKAATTIQASIRGFLTRCKMKGSCNGNNDVVEDDGEEAEVGHDTHDDTSAVAAEKELSEDAYVFTIHRQVHSNNNAIHQLIINTKQPTKMHNLISMSSGEVSASIRDRMRMFTNRGSELPSPSSHHLQRIPSPFKSVSDNISVSGVEDDDGHEPVEDWDQPLIEYATQHGYSVSTSKSKDESNNINVTKYRASDQVQNGQSGELISAVSNIPVSLLTEYKSNQMTSQMLSGQEGGITSSNFVDSNISNGLLGEVLYSTNRKFSSTSESHNANHRVPASSPVNNHQHQLYQQLQDVHKRGSSSNLASFNGNNVHQYYQPPISHVENTTRDQYGNIIRRQEGDDVPIFDFRSVLRKTEIPNNSNSNPHYRGMQSSVYYDHQMMPVNPSMTGFGPNIPPTSSPSMTRTIVAPGAGQRGDSFEL